MQSIAPTQEHETGYSDNNDTTAFKKDDNNLQVSTVSKPMSDTIEIEMKTAKATDVDQLMMLHASQIQKVQPESKSITAPKRKRLMQGLPLAKQDKEETEIKRKRKRTKLVPRSVKVQNLIASTPISKLYNAPIFVTIGAGDDARTFEIHQGLLCHHSTYFRSAFTGPFTEAQTGHITLAKEDPDLFATVYAWLYTKKLTIPTAKYGKMIDGDLEMENLVDVFIFGDIYDFPRLRNAAIDGLIRRYELYDDVHFDVRKVYENTTPNNPLRRLVVAIHTCQPPNMEDFYDKYKEPLMEAPEFMLDVSVALMRAWGKGAKPWETVKQGRCIKDGCLRFHQHGEDDEDECE